MTENTLISPSIKHLTFKGRFKGRTTNFMPKVVSKRFTITDAFHNRYKTTITVYIPKLNTRYLELQTMLHMVNGAGSCQFRVKDPVALAKTLRDIADVLTSNEWLDKAFRVEDLANHIRDTGGELPLCPDEEIIDINDFKASMLNDVNVSTMDVDETEKQARVEHVHNEILRKKGISEALT